MSDRSSSRGLSVLVVDDHRISREYTAAALRVLAASVKQAGSAGEALRTAMRDRPELICVDLDLAGESGLDLIRCIRESWPAGTPHPLMFVLSAERPSPEQLRVAGPGVEGFLLKPVEPDRLRDHHLRRRRHRRALPGLEGHRAWPGQSGQGDPAPGDGRVALGGDSGHGDPVPGNVSAV